MGGLGGRDFKRVLKSEEMKAKQGGGNKGKDGKEEKKGKDGSKREDWIFKTDRFNRGDS